MKRIIAIVAIMIIILTGCSMFGSGNTADYDENSNELKVPGATIILDGEEYDGEATVSENTMALIVKDDKAYFYSPKQGNVELTVENSAEAIAIYLDYVLSENAKGIKGQYDSPVGIKVTDVSTGQYEFLNTYDRWSGVSLVNNGSDLLLKPVTLFDISCGEMLFGNWGDVVSFNEMSAGTLSVSGTDTTVIMGSVIRAGLLSVTPIGMTLSFINRLIFDQDDAGIYSDIQSCWEKDRELFVKVNTADLIELITIIAKPIVGSNISGEFTSALVGELTGEMGDGLNTVIANGSSGTTGNLLQYCLKSGVNVISNALVSQIPVLGQVLSALRLITDGLSVIAGGVEGIIGDNYDLYALEGGSILAPEVTTGSTTLITSSSATLNGTVNPNGLSTDYYFEWGQTTSYGNQTTSVSAGSGETAINVSEDITGLTDSTTYHYRLVAQNSEDTSYGNDMNFMTGETFINGPSSYLVLDGDSDYVHVTSEVDLSYNRTFCAWINSQYLSSDKRNSHLVFYGDVYWGDYNYYFYIKSDTTNYTRYKIAYGHRAGGDARWSSDYIPINEWHHVAATWDESEVQFYIDGLLDTVLEYTVYPTGTGSGEEMTIGCTYSSDLGYGYYGPSFQGYISELSLWNKVLSESEINNCMNQNISGTEDSIAAYWPFNQNANDMSGNGHDGTLKGDAYFVQ